MNYLKYLTSFLLILLAATNVSGSPDSLVARGNRYYSEKQYEEAIELYTRVIDSGWVSAELYYNLGNAYFRNNQLTKALLSYERAAIIDPDDEELQHNLGLARSFVIDEIDAIPGFVIEKWLTSFAGMARSDNWAVISMAAFVLALALLLIYLFSRRTGIRRLSFWLSVAVFSLSLISFYAAHKKKQMDTEHHLALITEPSVTVKSAPDESGTDVFQLHEGTRVTVVDSLGEWYEIRLSDGNRGWLRQEALAEI